MKVFIVKPPRKIWPYISEDDNFLLPQALPVLGAVIKKAFPKIKIKIIDCLPYKIGWKSLIKIIEKEKPDILCLSESELVWVNEANKLAKITKNLSPKTTIIAGGICYSFLPRKMLKENPIDYLVIGEGEITLVELLNNIFNKKTDYKTLKSIKGIAFKHKNKIIITNPRELVKDLDSVPLPAYDLLNMKAYGRSKLVFHPGSVTIYHSKGCPYDCDFCVCWRSNSERIKTKNGIKYYPSYRTKSVMKVIEELELLYKKYKIRGFVFTDDNWSCNADWSLNFAKEVLKRKLKFNWYAFMRADTIIRDHKKGILKLLVKAGLSHVAIGVERLDDKELKSLNKNYTKNLTFKAFRILRKFYPSVFRHGTFVVGTRDESKKSIKNLIKQINLLDIDMPSFSPLTPLPGTKLYEEATKKGWLESTNFEDYDWFTPVMSSKYLSREEIENYLFYLNRTHFSIIKFLKNLLSPYPYRRKMYFWFIRITIRIIFSELKENYFRFWKIERPFTKLIKPKYYET